MAATLRAVGGLQPFGPGRLRPAQPCLLTLIRTPAAGNKKSTICHKIFQIFLCAADLRALEVAAGLAPCLLKRQRERVVRPRPPPGKKSRPPRNLGLRCRFGRVRTPPLFLRRTETGDISLSRGLIWSGACAAGLLTLGFDSLPLGGALNSLCDLAGITAAIVFFGLADGV